LQRAQELGLGEGREIAHLVKKDRTAVGELEAALALLGGAGEGALLVAETARRTRTAWARREAMIIKRRRSSSRQTSSAKRRSVLEAPKTSPPLAIGAHKNATSRLSRLARARVLSRKRGASLMRSTSAGRPDCTTPPVTPSPRR
jgi:hypothetical protein